MAEGTFPSNHCLNTLRSMNITTGWLLSHRDSLFSDEIEPFTRGVTGCGDGVPIGTKIIDVVLAGIGPDVYTTVAPWCGCTWPYRVVTGTIIGIIYGYMDGCSIAGWEIGEVSGKAALTGDGGSELASLFSVGSGAARKRRALADSCGTGGFVNRLDRPPAEDAEGGTLQSKILGGAIDRKDGGSDVDGCVDPADVLSNSE